MRKERTITINHNKNQEYYTVLDLKYLLSYNADYTAVSSIRNLGKSYSAMELSKEKIEQGKTILWERYNRDEFKIAKKTLENFFGDSLEKPNDAGGYLEYENENTGGKLLLCQTSVVNIKGYDDILEHLPVFEIKDEFLPVRYTNNTRFLNEYNDAMEIRKTFKRNGPMRSIYLSNCLNWLNPYTINWGMTPINTGTAKFLIDTFSVKTEDGVISDSRTIIWESVKPTSAQIKRIMRTEVSSMNVNSLDDYIDNEFYKEYGKIGKCPDMGVQLEPIQLMSEGYYFGFRIYNGRFYFCKIKPRSNVRTYVAEKPYIDIDTQHYRYPALGSEFEDKFNAGLCIFDDTKTLMAYQRWLINLRKRV